MGLLDKLGLTNQQSLGQLLHRLYAELAECRGAADPRAVADTVAAEFGDKVVSDENTNQLMARIEELSR